MTQLKSLMKKIQEKLMLWHLKIKLAANIINEAISDIKSAIYYRTNSITSFIHRIVDFIPALYQDRDYDYHGIYILIHKKLKRLHSHMLSGIGDHSHKHLKAIKVAIKLSERLKSEYYIEHFLKKHEIRWGEGQMDFHSIGKSGSHRKSFRMSMMFPKAKNLHQNTQAEMEIVTLTRLAYNIEAKRSRLLFHIISKYLYYWWD